MESHILNTYHQARYRTIGHKILRSSESVSSESSCNQNSPEYAQSQQYPGRYGSAQGIWRKGQEWSRNQTINMTRSQDTSSDEDENIEVQEVSFEGKGSDHQYSDDDNVEDNTLVEGDDYDVIQVYAVDPNLDLEVSSDEEHEDYAIKDTAYVVQDKEINYNQNLTPDVLNFNLDTPVVSNVDEYFIKEEKDILAIKDEPIVQDVDEYFIKEEKPKVPHIGDFVIIKNNSPEEDIQIQFDVPKPLNVDEFFVTNTNKAPDPVIEQDNTEEPTNENVFHSTLPTIEELRRYFFEDMTCSKIKSAQRSCSLPQSPMHNICLDMDDAKTCLSFEDLNLDLSDLNYDNDKDKSVGSIKNDDLPRILTEEDVNSFLITNKPMTQVVVKNEDDFSHEDMEIERPVESTTVDPPVAISNKISSSTPKKSTPTPVSKTNVLDFCIEKSSVKIENTVEVKIEPLEDFVDVESCNETVIPVLEANNLSSLLEQFEATETLNTKPKKSLIKTEEQKVKTPTLTNGTRLQDAGVQLTKNKMRQILMPSTINATVRRSPSPVHSDHDYCSPKKRYSLPNIKKGQSLLKPEVLSSNSRILNSRHRSCKNKKVVYHEASDDESEKCKIKKLINNRSEDSDIKIKSLSVKTLKISPNTTRKKLSPEPSVSNDTHKDKSNNSVIVKDACKASDTPCSQNSNSSIKLTIKRKSEVILNCDDKDSQKSKSIEKCKPSSVSEKTVIKVETKDNVKIKSEKSIKELDSDKNKNVVSIENRTSVNIKEESRPKEEHFYTSLFSNKQDVQIPQVMQVKSEKRSFEEELSIVTKISNKETEQPIKKKKLNLREYKLRRGVSSNNSSSTVSPEAIFPDITNSIIDKPKPPTNQTLNGSAKIIEQPSIEAPKKIFDPIREASRKILMNTKKQKAEAIRKRDENIVMSKIPKVENLELQPLISDAEMMKIVGMATAEAVPKPIIEKPQPSVEYEEIVMVSIGINTDDAIFKELAKAQKVNKSPSPEQVKSLINFKIKKSDHVLKQNVFDSVKRDKKSPVNEKRNSEVKIDKERFKGITATLKSVGKQVDTKISSNSLFASIQDVVMKKAPGDDNNKKTSPKADKNSKYKPCRQEPTKYVKATIVRDYDDKAEHGEDKVILHLGKDRTKPKSTHIVVQTDPDPEFTKTSLKIEMPKVRHSTNRKRTDSDMSMSSECSPVKQDTIIDERVSPKSKSERHTKRSQSKEKRSRSRERYVKYKRSRSRSRKRRRSYTRSRSRDYRRYRRSDSPYRKKHRSRSPYRFRQSPSIRREYRSKRSRSRNTDGPRSRSPMAKKDSPQRNGLDRKSPKSVTPPKRKQSISESSDTSTSSSSSSSSSSDDSRKSLASRSSSVYRNEYRKTEYRSSYSSEDREGSTPVEERRIVFVGKLEKDVTRSTLRSQFSKFGSVLEVRLHSKEDGTRYGFVTYKHARDAWSAVESASTFPQYDVGFGGRRAFCRQTYADLDGLEAKYTESAFHGASNLASRRTDDLSFEQMLLEMKKKLSQRKDKQRPDDKP